jgi:hypothetical protein
MSELVPTEALPVATDIDTAQVGQVMELMRQAIDAGHGNMLPDLHKIYTAEREDARRRAYTTAKLAMAHELPTITKDGVILNKQGAVQSRFSSWPHLKTIIDPILLAHNFVLDHRTGFLAEMKMPTVEAVLQHATSGHVEYGGPMPLPFDTSGGKNAVQGSGSSIAYGKRYTTIAILGIVEKGVDNDGNGPAVQASSLDDMFADQLHESRQRAAQGTEAYSAWFKRQSQTVRGYLVDSGAHDTNKKAAAAHDQ